MYLFFLLIGLLLFLAVCALIIVFVKPQNPKKTWRLIFAALIVVCIADHLVGHLYGRVWVWLADGDASDVIRADSVAFRYSKEPTYRTWYDPLNDKNFDPWPPESPSELRASFLAHKLADGFSTVQGYAKNYSSDGNFGPLFEVRVSTRQNDPACQWIRSSGLSPKVWIEDRIELHKWLQQIRRNWKNSEHAACPALHSISRISARYLVESSLNMPPTPIERILGLSEFDQTRIVDIEQQRVMSESRAAKFHGGWVARFLSMGYEFGLSFLFVRRFAKGTPAEMRIGPATAPTVS